ncbi:MAG: hypothetical protein AAFX87_24030 [Bacteroidota bacterium]
MKTLIKYIVVSLLLQGCQSILFVETVPNDAGIVRKLPDYFNGIYKPSGADLDYFFIDMDRVNDGHCIMKYYFSFPKNSFDEVSKLIGGENSKVTLNGNSLFIYKGDTLNEVINLNDAGNNYESDKTLYYEINLNEGYLITDFEKLEKQRILLKERNDEYFLNILQDEHWFLVHWNFNNNQLNFTKATINDTTFTENLSYYRGITEIGKIEGTNDYFANPTDEELFALISEANLFDKEQWVKVSSNSYRTIIIIGCIIAIILFVTLYLGYRRRKSH